MTLPLFFIFIIGFTEEIECTTNPEIILRFAENLQSEGDYYRAISEYKRFIYFCSDSVKSDSILYIISSLYQKMGQFENSLATLMKIKNRDEKKYLFELGKVYFLAGDYRSAREFWNRSDTLIGWTYLREKNFRRARYYLGFNDNPRLKKPLYGALLSGIMPGLGRVYAGRTGDGISSFLLTAGFALSSFVYYKREQMVPSTIFGSLASLFYLGEIYGSILSVKIYNEKKTEDFIHNIEIKLGLLKWGE